MLQPPCVPAPDQRAGELAQPILQHVPRQYGVLYVDGAADRLQRRPEQVEDHQLAVARAHEELGGGGVDLDRLDAAAAT